MLKKFTVVPLAVAIVAMSTMAAQATITVIKDSSAFNVQSDGIQIWDGSAYVGDWDGAAASGGTTLDYSIANTDNLRIDQTTNNGWLQHDNDLSPWESLTSADSWTAEMRIHVISAPGGFSLWGAVPGVGAGIITVNDNGITPGAGTTVDLDQNDNTDGFHIFRLAYDQSENDYSVWRDGVLLTDSQTQTLNTGLSRFIAGDCCSSYGGVGNVVEIDYIRYDTTGAYKPIPEPATMALLGVGGLALFLRRRK